MNRVMSGRSLAGGNVRLRHCPSRKRTLDLPTTPLIIKHYGLCGSYSNIRGNDYFRLADHSLSDSQCRGWECTRETSSIVTVWVASGLPLVSRQFQSLFKLPKGSHFSKVTVSACSFHSFWQRPSLALAVLASRIPDRLPQTLSIRATFRG
jgi:hypothetical protein